MSLCSCLGVPSRELIAKSIYRSIWAAEGGKGACNYHAIQIQNRFEKWFHWRRVWSSLDDQLHAGQLSTGHTHMPYSSMHPIARLLEHHWVPGMKHGLTFQLDRFPWIFQFLEIFFSVMQDKPLVVYSQYLRFPANYQLASIIATAQASDGFSYNK